MENIISIFSFIGNAYLILGGIATFYVLIIFLMTGHNVFDYPTKPVLPISHKVSYVIVMSILFPVFYAIYYKEILRLSSAMKRVKLSLL